MNHINEYVADVLESESRYHRKGALSKVTGVIILMVSHTSDGKYCMGWSQHIPDEANRDLNLDTAVYAGLGRLREEYERAIVRQACKDHMRTVV